MSNYSDFSDHPDVMVSSTYTDLTAHREAVYDALLRLGFFPVGMEYDSAKAGRDIIASSMGMVAKAHAYIGIISHRYGAVPHDTVRNPDELSITELEYREAVRRNVPVFMFLMSDDHSVKRQDVEPVENYQSKLRALKAEAQSRSICATFSSLEELTSRVLQSMSEFKVQLAGDPGLRRKRPRRKMALTEPRPPELFAIPTFISGHQFVGRRDELRWLDEWATGSDSLLVVEAIGGAGKSTLAWQWLNERAMITRPDFAGRLWYSFYEGGADMAAFAAHAFTYVTEQPLANFRGRKLSELTGMLVAALRRRPFLLVLDGLERVLVAYHRLDASQTRDDEVGSGKDDRACIKPADGDLLRQLVAVGPSKILITSRLLPTALLNKSGELLPGARHLLLGGLAPDDALTLIRSVGVRGDGVAIQRYLKENFDNHPQIVGVVAGLVKDYFREPGNFDRWSEDPQAGAALHLSKLNLVQRQTHILAAALNGLDTGVRQVLSRIAALGSAVHFDTVEALNPFMPPPPSKAELTKGGVEMVMNEYKSSAKVRQALPRLVSALRDLEKRGLLQWDRQKNTYDLHPVVRGYAFDVLDQPERVDICGLIADHFRSKPADRYSEVKTLEDVQQSMNLFRALVQASRFDGALGFYRGAFANALSYSIEAYHEIVAMLKPLFPNGFAQPPTVFKSASDQSYLLNNAAVALIMLGRLPEARAVLTAKLRLNLMDNWDRQNIRVCLTNLGETLRDENRLAQAHAAFALALELSEADSDPEGIARCQWHLMTTYRIVGQLAKSRAAYNAFRSLPTPTNRAIYRAGDAEGELCWLSFYEGQLTNEQLIEAERIAQAGNNRTILRGLIRLRGELALEQRAVAQAVAAFESVIEMTQAVGLAVDGLEARLALVKARAGEPESARYICDRLHELEKPPRIELAAAYLELGDDDRARRNALAGYSEAWADGPPYSRWWELKQCRAVLRILGEPEPRLLDFDTRAVEPLPYEDEIRGIIAGLKQKRTGR